MIEVVREVKLTITAKVENVESAAAFMKVAVEDAQEALESRMQLVAEALAKDFNEGSEQYSGFHVNVSSEVV